jgi:hypothetical protein
MNSQIIQQELQRDNKTIQTISQIDAQIQNVYSNLELLSIQTSPDLKKQNALLEQIDKLQQLKSSLYTSVSDSYISTQSNVAEARNSLVNEMAVTNIVGQELQNANHNLSALEQARNNKVRMAEINNYYSEKYIAQTNVMKTIVYFCIPILILGILMKKEFIPNNIATAFIGILVGLAVVVVIFQGIDLYSRSNMVYSEYKFPFDPNNVDLDSESNDDDQPKRKDRTLSCAAEACCPEGNVYGTVWDNSSKQCVTPKYKDSHSEGFVGSKCVQNAFGTSSFNINVFKNNSNGVKGYSNTDNTNYTTF